MLPEVNGLMFYNKPYLLVIIKLKIFIIDRCSGQIDYFMFIKDGGLVIAGKPDTHQIFNMLFEKSFPSYQFVCTR